MICEKYYLGQEKVKEFLFFLNHFLGTIVESKEHNMIPLYSTVFQ